MGKQSVIHTIHKEGKTAIHMVSAWAKKAGITLGQIKVNEKSNKITAIPELLDFLEIEGNIVTIDAMEGKKDWENLHSISLERSSRIIEDKKTTEDRFYISSIPADAKRHNHIIRKHWGIENSLH